MVGMLIGAACFGALILLPINFVYWQFALILLASGIGSGLFAAPNATAIMNSVPASERGQASGMRATFQNAGQVLSIGIFFSLVILGLSSTLPNAIQSGLTQQGVPAAVATQIANQPPVSSLFAAFLGYNPIEHLVPAATLNALPAQNSAALTGNTFFPSLISAPFKKGLAFAFTLSLIAYLIAAAASWLRGNKYVHDDITPIEEIA
jgi:hypothetical protein